jgi:hypothetical protein
MSRWYLPDGTVLDRPKRGAVPSVTTVLSGVWPKPAIIAWREKQLLKAAAGTPPSDNWEEDVKATLAELTSAGAERGREIHAMLEAGRDAEIPGLQDIYNYYGIVPAKCQRERTLVGPWYGGTMDLLHPEYIVDYKTTSTEMTVYDDWLLQLAGYDQLLEDIESDGGRTWLVIIIDQELQRPARVFEAKDEHRRWASGAWSAALSLWQATKSRPRLAL